MDNSILLIVSLSMSAVALVIAVISLLYVRKQKKDNQTLLRHMMRELSASSNGAVGMGQRLLAMEKKLESNVTANRQKMDYQNDDTFKPYSEAIQLLKMGVSTEEVSTRCGLSRAETSLLEMMHNS
jgi:uncharacterized protein YoxC